MTAAPSPAKPATVERINKSRPRAYQLAELRGGTKTHHEAWQLPSSARAAAVIDLVARDGGLREVTPNSASRLLFLLERAGPERAKLKRLPDLAIEFDFDLGYGLKDPELDLAWCSAGLLVRQLIDVCGGAAQAGECCLATSPIPTYAPCA